MAAGRFDAVILAGQRAGERDEVAKAAGVACKALAPVGKNDKPMIEHVIGALRESGAVNDIHVIGRLAIGYDDIHHHDPAESPGQSVLEVFDRVRKPFLLTTADHALLTGDMVLRFVAGLDVQKYDAAAAMIPLSHVKEKYPQTERTSLNFADGGYKACNLFCFNSDKARNLLTFWRKIEDRRKQPLRLAFSLGPLTLCQYALGGLSLHQAFKRLGARTSTSLQAVMLDNPDAAIDVDSAADYEFVKEILASR